MMTLFLQVLELSIQASIMISIIFLLKLVFKNRLSPKWHYYIWLLIIVKLLIPIEIESQMSIIPHVDLQEQYYTSFDVVTTADEEILPLQGMTETNSIQNKELNLVHLIPILWLAVFTVLILYNIYIEVGFYFKQKKYKYLRDSTIEHILDKAKRELNINRYIQVKVAEESTTPKIYGIINPCIIVDESTLIKADETMIYHLFLHEINHLKHYDLIINTLSMLVKCIYWFNPLVHIAMTRMRDDCEVACDTSVLKQLPRKDHRQYGYTLLHAIQLNKASTCLALSLGSKKQIARRLTMIRDYKKSKLKTVLASTGLACLLAVTCFSTPISYASDYINEPLSQVIPFDKQVVHISMDTDDQIIDSKETTFIRPLESGRVTAPFGNRKHPILDEEFFHKGIDIAAVTGTEILASADGQVIYSDWAGSYGKLIIIEHADGYQTKYAHMSHYKVNEGDEVKQGQVIATVGTTGNVTGPHLHFEVLKDEENIDPQEVFE